MCPCAPSAAKAKKNGESEEAEKALISQKGIEKQIEEAEKAQEGRRNRSKALRPRRR